MNRDHDTPAKESQAIVLKNQMIIYEMFYLDDFFNNKKSKW